MIKDDFSINFSGFTHDHATLTTTCSSNNGHNSHEKATCQNQQDDSCSTIAILRRHPMYDCLVLVKKYRNCLGGYSLEFPSDNLKDNEAEDGEEMSGESENRSSCSRRKLVSRFLDGDDPIYKPCVMGNSDNNSTELASNENVRIVGGTEPFVTQVDDRGDQCDLVHVPINGLMDRLKNYTQSGVAVDSRVYAFAMGLKTAERILATGSMKELQETPI